MLFYFIINGREDIRERVDKILEAQLPEVSIQYKKYYSVGSGDATRIVRMYCEFYPKDEVCFVACGGSGTANEVASGIVGSENKSMGILSFGDTEDVTKYWPDKDFRDLKKLVDGQVKNIDIIKAGDSYCVNVINAGFDARVAFRAVKSLTLGYKAEVSYPHAIISSMVGRRSQKIQIYIDGIPYEKKRILICTIGNGCQCGGRFRCTPLAKNDDGLMDVLLVRPMTLLEFIIVLIIYAKGNFLQNRFFMRRAKYFKAKNLKLVSKDLIYLCLDGEFDAFTEFDIEVLPGAIQIRLPESEQFNADV